MKQSIWYDNIERTLLGESGPLATMIREENLRGVTSNPSIYQKAIEGSADYDADIVALKGEGLSAREIFYRLAVADIQEACDLFKGVYEESGGRDGFVSLEISPDLADDVEGSVAEGLALWRSINRPNAMIKVPATAAGILVIESLISAGVNVNATLIFSLAQYLSVAQAYLLGLKSRIAKGESVAQIASVASFFISRIDSAVDPLLEISAPHLLGRVAIANAKQAYRAFEELFNGEGFAQLRKKGAQKQRLLWASTGVKNPKYGERYYLDALYGAESVNTLPPATYELYRKSAPKEERLTQEIDEAITALETLDSLGIDLCKITRSLEEGGVRQFEEAFGALLAVIERK